MVEYMNRPRILRNSGMAQHILHASNVHAKLKTECIQANSTRLHLTHYYHFS
jgi:hypothetical protein